MKERRRKRSAEEGGENIEKNINTKREGERRRTITAWRFFHWPISRLESLARDGKLRFNSRAPLKREQLRELSLSLITLIPKRDTLVAKLPRGLNDNAAS